MKERLRRADFLTIENAFSSDPLAGSVPGVSICKSTQFSGQILSVQKHPLNESCLPYTEQIANVQIQQ